MIQYLLIITKRVKRDNVGRKGSEDLVHTQDSLTLARRESFLHFCKHLLHMVRDYGLKTAYTRDGEEATDGISSAAVHIMVYCTGDRVGN